MRRGAALAIMMVALAVTAANAEAQTWFSNPFLSAAEVRAQRGETSVSARRYVYEQSVTIGDAAPAMETIVIDAADDWALITRGNRRQLYDFRSSRVFLIDGAGAFVAVNHLALVSFRVAETYNRAGIAAMLRQAGGEGPSACEAETELGVFVPNLRRGEASLVQEGNAVRAICDGSAVSEATMGDGAQPPRSFWPVIAQEFQMHPSVRGAVFASGRAPRSIAARFEGISDRPVQRSWRLVSEEQASIAFPLTDDLRNGSAAALNAQVDGLGDLAVEAVAGRAQGGPLTLESFDAAVGARAAAEPGGAALMFVGPGSNMFPGVLEACRNGRPLNMCAVMRNLRSMMENDPAVRAHFLISSAEQEGRLEEVVPALQAAKDSPLARDPVLMASYALALLRGGDALAREAQAAQLPTGVVELQMEALRAYPYTGAYWLDLSNTFAAGFDFVTVFLIFDTVFALPGPAEQQQAPLLVSRRAALESYARQFPDFFPPAQ